MHPADIWRHLGGRGDAPSCLGSCAGPLLILGGGRSVWEDFDRVRPWKGEIMAVNDIGAFLHERVRHWVTLHPEYFPGWRTYRQKHLYGQGIPATCHSHKSREGVDKVWPVENVGGTSGLFAVFIGLMLGYSEIVLGGVPMTDDGHFFDAPWYRSDFQDKAISFVWRQARDNIFAGRVKSLSGNTRDWLGAPAGLDDSRLHLVNGAP